MGYEFINPVSVALSIPMDAMMYVSIMLLSIQILHF